MHNSKYDILFIESCHLSIVSRYGTGMEVSYLYHSKEWSLSLFDRISSHDPFMYVFVGPVKINVSVIY